MASRFVDVNNDRIPDLVLGGQGGPTPSPNLILLNDGRGNFTPAAANALPARFGVDRWSVVFIAAADFDGDGYVDLIMVTTDTYQGPVGLQLLLNNRNGTFRDASSQIPFNGTELALSTVSVNTKWIQSVTPVDINGDGKMDFVTHGGAQFVPRLFLNQGGANFMDMTEALPPLPHVTKLYPADYDEDGKLDIFAPSVLFPDPFLYARGIKTIALPSSAGCSYALSLGTRAVAAQGENWSVDMTTGPDCPWFVSEIPAWVKATSASSGMGSATINFQATANVGGAQATSFTIAGTTFNVEQQASTIPGAVFTGSLAHIASAGTWKTTFDFINLGVAAAQARISFFGDSGSSLPLPLTFPQLPPAAGPLLASSFDRVLNPGASLVIESTGPDAQPTSVGWSQLLTDGSISGFALFSNPFYHWDAVVPLESRNAGSYLLAFDNTGGLVTGLAIANLVNQAANITVIVRNSAGVQIGSFNLLVPAMGHTSFMLKDNYPITSDQRGTIEFQRPAGGWISILGLRANGPSVTTLPVLADVGTTGGSITHTLFNGEWTAGYTLVNTGATAASATLKFFAEDGTGLSVPLSLPQTSEVVTGTSITKIIPARGSLLIETVGQAALPVIVGSARLTTTGNISGFGIFKWLPFGQEASVSLESRNPTAYVLAYDNTNGLATGLALAEVSGTAAATIPVIVRDDAGVSLTGATSINLPVNGHTSFMLPGAFPSTVGKRGTVEFQTPPGGRISVIGLRATPTGNVTTIPVLAK